jgi:hypothetical protein
LNKPVRLLPEVRDELDEAALWYDERQHGLGMALVRAFEEVRNEIGADPGRFPRASDSSVARQALLSRSRFPYRVVFVETAEDVVIVAFAHFSQRPDYWKKRRAVD